jgi:tripartite-type tricarboxylate transporter receptor subunit TctC
VHIKAGKLRALAVTTTTRLDVLPEIPVMADFVPGYESSAWVGFGAPKDTSAAIIELLNREVNAASPIPRSKQALPGWVPQCLHSSPLHLENLLPKTPKSGPK